MFRIITIRAITALVVGAGIVCCAVRCGPIHPAQPGPPPKTRVKIAVMPRYSPYTMSKSYRPLIKYLREETGYDIRYVSSVGYRGFLSAVESTGADIAFLNPLAYVTLHKTRGAYPLVIALEPDFTVGPPRAQYRGVILARTDAGINSVSDLRGKIIVTGSEMAVAGYLAPKALCRQEGVDIDKEATVAVCPTQEQVIHRLRQGRAQAGFVREGIWEEASTSSLATADIKPIAYTVMYPGWCVCALGDTDQGIAQTVKRALLKLDWRDSRYRAVLKDEVEEIETGLRGFVEADDKEYDSVRDLLQSLKMPY